MLKLLFMPFFTEKKVRIGDMYRCQNCPLPSELASSVRKHAWALEFKQTGV